MDKIKIINTLSTIYEASNTSDDYEGLVKALESIKINSLVSYYIHVTDIYDFEDVIIIEFIIKILQNLYNNSGVQSPITDEDYDILYEVYLRSTTKDIVGGDLISIDRDTTSHNYPDLRGTLDKIHFLKIADKGKDKRKSLEEWKRKCENKLGRRFRDDEMKIALYPKFDGVSVVFECDEEGNVIQALTRGDTTNNEATIVNHIFGAIKFKTLDNWNSKFGVKTEVVMSNKNYEKFCKRYGTGFKNSRSAASSIINSFKDYDIKFLKYLTIIPLRMQNYDTKEIIVPGYPIVEYPVKYSTLTDYEDINNSIIELREFTKTLLDLPIDGVVIQLIDKNIQSLLGREGAINKFEVAFKFVPESKKTTLIDIEFCIGVLGSITPVAKIEPVKINGNTITNVSLGSMDRFESLGLRKGDEVLIKYDIIPYLNIDDNTCKRSKNPVIEAPTHCQYCGSKLLYDPILRCVNNNCPSRIVGKIVNYTTKMNIENISIGIVTALFKEGYLNKIEDLYSLKKHKNGIINIDGFGEKSFEKLVKSIEKRTEVYDYVMLGSIGIPDIASKIFKSILSIYYIDELKQIAKNNDIKKLTSIKGIKEKTALKVISGILLNYDLINFLQKTLIVKHDGREYKMRVVFTKIRDKEFEKYLESINVEVCSSYNKNIDIVICDDSNSESDKIKKARKDGKKILNINEAYSFFKYNI